MLAISSKLIRPWLTSVFIVCGGIGGWHLATYYISNLNLEKQPMIQLLGINIGFIVLGALIGLVIERRFFHYITKVSAQFERMLPTDKIIFASGIVMGLVLTALLHTIIYQLNEIWWLNIVIACALCYVSLSAMNSMKEQISFYFPNVPDITKNTHEPSVCAKVLDTNVIIDGRIADICKAGFLEGTLYVPKFILQELQLIADSADSLRRARGKRGLDILNQMQKENDLQVPELKRDHGSADVDSRLVLAALELSSAIVTNDYNLNRVAALQGVNVLNINELANALKPVVLPGEEMVVDIVKEGKEKDQGVGYLDDGTMIVVEGARRMIGETLDVAVTSVLQTVQGKMIFGKMKEGSEHSVDNSDRNGIRAFAGSRSRTKIQ